MAGAENSEKAVLRLKLLVDKKKNKVVLAEAGKKFVDVLFSFLTLPMGTIVRLMEKHQKNQVSEVSKIGCFNNLYKSVLDIGTDNFMAKGCKDMLSFPRSVKENQCKRLKININDTETLKYYTCPDRCYNKCYSNLCSSKCYCGELMTMEFFLFYEEIMEFTFDSSLAVEEIFVSHKHLFTITDDLIVGFTSISHTMKMLKMLGYYDVNQLHETHVDVDHEKAVALLLCLLSSDTPFTDVFLTQKRLRVIPKVLNMSNLSLQEESRGVTQSNEIMSVSVFSRKLDKKVLYIESEKDFVDLLFTFLVLPLDYALKLAGSHLGIGCIDNLSGSFNCLSSIEGGNALKNKFLLPGYYTCQKPLLDVCYAEGRSLTAIINSSSCYMSSRDPSYHGFLKRGITYMVSDDLIVTPTDLSSTICSLKKWNLDLDDIEEQVINITKAEATRLLRASFVTTSVLNTVFQSLLSKKPKEEKA